MATKRQQLNVRIEDSDRELMDRLIPAIAEKLGLKISQTDLFRLGLAALREKYLPDKKKGGKK